MKQKLTTSYPISFSNRREEKGRFSFIGKEANKVLETGDLQLIGVAPDEEVGEGKFRNGGKKPYERSFDEASLFER
jgi:hypothetical protein